VPTRAQKLMDRFKPTIFDRLKQSAEAKQKPRNVVPAQPAQPAESSKPTVLFAPHQEIRANNSNIFRTIIDDSTWATWNFAIAGSSSATTSVTGANDVWRAWLTNAVYGSTITTTSTRDVWSLWQAPHQDVRLPRSEVTQEQQRIRAAQDAAYEEERRAAANRRKEAEARAMKLLISVLNEQQKADLRRDKHFFVDAPSGRLYRIDYGTHGNVKVVDRRTRQVIESPCIQPQGVPAGDANLMQKLLIETAEDMFRAHANISPVGGSVIYGDTALLTGDRLADVIPIRRAA
jgi:hypothetical protein